jgi:hypothetical protein
MRSMSIPWFAVAVLIIAATLVSFQQQTETMANPNSIIYDRQFVEAMRNISRVLPDNERLVVSSNGPIVTYFTGHTAVVPWPVTSKQGLVNYMHQRGYSFLLAFENKSDVIALKALFSSEGLRTLEPIFVPVEEYRTEFYVLILYQLAST